MRAGQSPDEIAGQLRSAGWPEDAIHQGFYAVQSAVLPSDVPSQTAHHQANSGQPHANGERRGRIRTGWQLFKQSWHVLRGNPGLLRYLYMTALWTAVIFVILFGVYWLLDQRTYDDTGHTNGLGYVVLFLGYLVFSFIVNLYAAGLTANVFDIFQGQRKSYHDYMRTAWSKAGPIFVYSLISSTVGILLQWIAERIRFVGWIIAWLLGTLWSLGTLFVIPIIVADPHPSGVRAIKQSVGFFKHTWGEDIVTKITVNGPLFLLNLAVIAAMILAMIPMVIVFGVVGFIIVFVLYILAILTLSVIGSFANSLINIALYYYATTHTVPPAFSEDLLNQVFVKRSKKGLFGRKLKTSEAAA